MLGRRERCPPLGSVLERLWLPRLTGPFLEKNAPHRLDGDLHGGSDRPPQTFRYREESIRCPSPSVIKAPTAQDSTPYGPCSQGPQRRSKPGDAGAPVTQTAAREAEPGPRSSPPFGAAPPPSRALPSTSLVAMMSQVYMAAIRRWGFACSA